MSAIENRDVAAVVEDNRAIVFHENDEIPTEQLSFCIATALTYHLSKKSRRS